MMKKNLSKSGDRFKKQNKTKITIDTNIQTKAMLRVNKVYKELKINWKMDLTKLQSKKHKYKQIENLKEE